MLPTVGSVCPHQVTKPITHRHTGPSEAGTLSLRHSSLMMLNCVTLTTKANRHTMQHVFLKPGKVIYWRRRVSFSKSHGHEWQHASDHKDCGSQSISVGYSCLLCARCTPSRSRIQQAIQTIAQTPPCHCGITSCHAYKKSRHIACSGPGLHIVYVLLLFEQSPHKFWYVFASFV